MIKYIFETEYIFYNKPNLNMEQRGPINIFTKRRSKNALLQTKSDSTSKLDDGNITESEASLAT